MKNLKDIIIEPDPRVMFPPETAHCAGRIRDIVFQRIECEILDQADDQVFYQIVQQLNNEKS